MPIGSVWTRKDLEFTVISKFKHKTEDHMVYVMQERRMGEVNVTYMLMYTELSEPHYEVTYLS